MTINLPLTHIFLNAEYFRHAILREFVVGSESKLVLEDDVVECEGHVCVALEVHNGSQAKTKFLANEDVVEEAIFQADQIISFVNEEPLTVRMVQPNPVPFAQFYERNLPVLKAALSKLKRPVLAL